MPAAAIFLALFALAHVPAARAEGTSIVVVPLPYYYGPFIDTERLPIFDDRVFNLKPKSFPETSPSGHFYGDEPDYTYDQRRSWIKQCAHFKKESFEKFRSCYEEAKERELRKTVAR